MMNHVWGLGSLAECPDTSFILGKRVVISDLLWVCEAVLG